MRSGIWNPDHLAHGPNRIAAPLHCRLDKLPGLRHATLAAPRMIPRNLKRDLIAEMRRIAERAA